jgi:RNA polymerase sigma-70 factor (ECF subfamily)
MPVLHRTENLTALMRAANRSDGVAYRTVLDALAVRLRAFACRGLSRAGRGIDEAEDIVQETLLAIHLKRHTWDEGQPLEPWVYAIARHKLVDHLRRKGFRDHVDIDDYAEILSATDGVEPERAMACADLMDGLSPRQRDIIEGVAIQGHSAREVGERMGMSEGAVRVAFHRALKALAAAGRRGES